MGQNRLQQKSCSNGGYLLKYEVTVNCSTHAMTEKEVKMEDPSMENERGVDQINNSVFPYSSIEVSVIYNSTPPYIALQNLRIFICELFFLGSF